jgi:tRNA(Ile)-lysidine synthase
MSRLNPASVERFKSDLSNLVATKALRLGVAVSGGPDSLALLLLAHTALPGAVVAATVDHGLRPEATDEANYVAELCAERGISHTILVPTSPISGSTQAAARHARYTLLNEWADVQDIGRIATAHHVDDQAETLIMRLNRGAGVAGLAGVRAMNGRIIRPLLGWRRQELANVVAEAGIRAIEDPSNQNLRYDRVRIRKALAGSDWVLPESFALSAALLAEANTALDWASAELAKERLILGTANAKLEPALLPREIRRRLTLTALAHVDPDISARGTALVELIEALGRGETRTLGQVLCKGGNVWRFSRAAPRTKN